MKGRQQQIYEACRVLCNKRFAIPCRIDIALPYKDLIVLPNVFHSMCSLMLSLCLMHTAQATRHSILTAVFNFDWKTVNSDRDNETSQHAFRNQSQQHTELLIPITTTTTARATAAKLPKQSVAVRLLQQRKIAVRGPLCGICRDRTRINRTRTIVPNGVRVWQTKKKMPQRFSVCGGPRNMM